MRTIATADITQAVTGICRQINQQLPEKVRAALWRAREQESSLRGREILDQLLDNLEIAQQEDLPLCQDTGMVVVFAELGREVRLEGDLQEAIDAGVARAYTEGYLRPSVLANPLERDSNTGDNTPAIVHLELVPGDCLTLHVAAKGGGSENMSALWMLSPSQGRAGLVEAVVARIVEAGGRPCPPLVLGLGIGGSFETAALLAKKALFRPLGQPSDDSGLADVEAEILERVNATGVGPLGLGGDTTALAVHAVAHPCHLASLPVALNLQCHAARHGTVVI